MLPIDSSFKNSIDVVFNIIAEINNWSPESAVIASDEYFELIDEVNDELSMIKTPMMGGEKYSTLATFKSWMTTGVNLGKGALKTVIGSWDSLCDKILFLITVGIYAVWVTNLISAVPIVAQYTWAEPVQYILSNYGGGLIMKNSIIKMIEKLSNALQKIYNSTFSNVKYMNSLDITANVRTQFWEGGHGIYGNVVLPIVSCSLKIVIESCEKICAQPLPIIKDVKGIAKGVKNVYSRVRDTYKDKDTNPHYNLDIGGRANRNTKKRKMYKIPTKSKKS
jgi:hypothetical protein